MIIDQMMHGSSDLSYDLAQELTLPPNRLFRLHLVKVHKFFVPPKQDVLLKGKPAHPT